METTRNLDDILHNIETLKKYQISSDENEREYHSELVKRGTCFVATMDDGDVFFSPSRFIGYLNNSLEKHDSNKTKDGRVTNPEIERILNKKFRVNEGLERTYQRFCYSIGFVPRLKGSFGVTRKYISVDVPNIAPDEFLTEDLEKINEQDGILETEKTQLVNARMGQGQFRESLLEYWKGCCCTDCKEPKMLRASHIKPWRLCSNKERLDPFNGLLLIPNLDQAFDNGLISFDENGKLVISQALSSEDAEKLSISATTKVQLQPKHLSYMQFHRDNIFIK